MKKLTGPYIGRHIEHADIVRKLNEAIGSITRLAAVQDSALDLVARLAAHSSLGVESVFCRPSGPDRAAALRETIADLLPEPEPKVKKPPDYALDHGEPVRKAIRAIVDRAFEEAFEPRLRLAIIAPRQDIGQRTAREMGLARDDYYVISRPDQIRGCRVRGYVMVAEDLFPLGHLHDIMLAVSPALPR